MNRKLPYVYPRSVIEYKTTAGGLARFFILSVRLTAHSRDRSEMASRPPSPLLFAKKKTSPKG
jgi:hypothetical protein